MREKGGKWYKDRGKCIKKFRIEFSDSMFMTLDNQHKNVRKMGDKLFPAIFGFWLKN